MTAETPGPPNDSLYSLQPTRPLSVVILRKSKLRPPASAWSDSISAIFMMGVIGTGYRGRSRNSGSRLAGLGVMPPGPAAWKISTMASFSGVFTPTARPSAATKPFR